MTGEPIYSPDDRVWHLSEPPYDPEDPAVRMWEQAHGHLVTQKCLPEYGCAAYLEALERAEDELRTLRPIFDEHNALHALLTHPAAAELLDHHRYLTSGIHGSCSCRGDYGPGTETPEQWIEHLLEAGRLEHGIGGGT